ncbi:hypothetical protein Q428_01415 [Fervidicella metallireducens AeB]|uniref:Pilus assembly protein PilO n=1 Tax=Fervidicella metallireducens AeB TaxID=1403537 RepID=A0A017RZA8_9CLOT|nr:hypothetical protein [Fervidicella metallireducens]EYE89739.1 hypothetical protein Q428_01415 [Fervidicella metallireducens AeB]
MENLAKRERILLIVLAFMVIFYLYYTLFLSPVLVKISDVNSRIKVYQLKAESIKNANVIIKRQQRELEGLKEKFKDATSAIPELERDAEIAYRLKFLAESKGVTLSSVNFAEATEIGVKEISVSGDLNGGEQNNSGVSNNVSTNRDKIYRVSCTAVLLGNYNQIVNLIADLEKDKRFVVIENFGVTSGAQNERLNATLNLNYFFTNNKTEGVVDYDFNNGTYGKENIFK